VHHLELDSEFDTNDFVPERRSGHSRAHWSIEACSPPLSKALRLRYVAAPGRDSIVDSKPNMPNSGPVRALKVGSRSNWLVDYASVVVRQSVLLLMDEEHRERARLVYTTASDRYTAHRVGHQQPVPWSHEGLMPLRGADEHRVHGHYCSLATSRGLT
jgi:hypothetical protein